MEFPAGAYLAGSIHLQERRRASPGPGSSIVASSEDKDYDPPEANAWGDTLHYQDGGHSHWHDSLIWGEDLTNVSITGQGRIYGKGLSRGWAGEKVVQKVGNKAIALRNCRNVILRDFTIEHGGWFGILATGVDNLTIDGLKIDTNRDGMDIDCCHNVRVSNCIGEFPVGRRHLPEELLRPGQFRSTENVTISDCLVCGYDEGTLLDGSRRHTDRSTVRPHGQDQVRHGVERRLQGGDDHQLRVRVLPRAGPRDGRRRPARGRDRLEPRDAGDLQRPHLPAPRRADARARRRRPWEGSTA